MENNFQQHISQPGDSVDFICWKAYGTTGGAEGHMLGAVFSANPGLADYGTVLPAGVRINLPPAGLRVHHSIKLWD